MQELIDRQAVRLLESDADEYMGNWNDDYEKGFCDAINKVLELPTIEPEVLMIKSDSVRNLTDEETAVFEEWLNHNSAIEPEVRHGRWTKDGCDYKYFYYKCSVCGVNNDGRTKFCPNCGAKMDGGADNG